MPNLLSYVGPTFLISLSLPLALLALVTTSLAFSTLFLRASVVYVELGLALVSNWLSNTFTHTNANSTARKMSLQLPTPQLRANSLRKSFDADTQMVEINTRIHRPSRSESFASLVGNAGPDRDFEGVGGWRLSRDMEEDAVWIGLNSRLELPSASNERPRRHYRSLSSQSHRFTRTSDSYKPSPADTRGSTSPVLTKSHFNELPGATGSYFSFRSADGSFMSQEESAAKNRMEQRRRSLSSTSGTSITSNASDRKHSKLMQIKADQP